MIIEMFLNVVLAFLISDGHGLASAAESPDAGVKKGGGYDPFG